MKLFILSQTARRWSLAMDKLCQPPHYNACNNLSMLGPKLILSSKQDPRKDYYCLPVILSMIGCLLSSVRSGSSCCVITSFVWSTRIEEPPDGIEYIQNNAWVIVSTDFCHEWKSLPNRLWFQMAWRSYDMWCKRLCFTSNVTWASWYLKSKITRLVGRQVFRGHYVVIV